MRTTSAIAALTGRAFSSRSPGRCGIRLTVAKKGAKGLKVGPIALFEKSFLQSLSVDESVWFDQFFIPVICPLFYVETLADLTKSDATARRSAEDEVRIIADKVPVLSGSPCANHRDMVISSLMGDSIPMTGQIPVAGGRPVRSSEGKKGVVFDESPESMAFTRWQHGEFMDVERSFAHGWRRMLTTLDLPTTADRMRKLGIGSKQCKTLKEAHAIATALVHGRDKPFDQMALLFTFVDIPRELTEPILQRWAIAQYRPLATYAPYAAHVLTVEIFFQIALAASLISADRPSNRVDIGYLFYLPFCMVFISGDKLHRNCAPLVSACRPRLHVGSRSQGGTCSCQQGVFPASCFRTGKRDHEICQRADRLG